MRGEKTIEFEFPIRYSENGEWNEATAVTVRAPGLDKFSIHSKMQSYVARAVFEFAKANEHLRKGAPTGSASVEDDAEVEDEAANADDQDVLVIMQMAMGVDDYAAFADFVRKTLTNAPRLASIGDSKQPIKDETWLSIEEAGGLEAVHKIISEFCGFFFDALKSQKKSGQNKPITSSSPTKAASAPSSRKASRLPN